MTWYAWYPRVLQQYTVFNGRSARPEFWYFTLVNLIITVVLEIIGSIALGSSGVFLYLLYSLAILLPSIGVGIRRLHDTNRSGWWLLISFIPIVGTIILIIFFAQPTDPGSNAYG